MTVKQLKQKLKNVPDHMDIFIRQTDNSDFDISPVEEAKIVKASFSEDTGPVLAKDDVFLLSDEL